MESLTVEVGAPAAAVPDDRCRPPPQASGALLDEAEAAAAPYPCGYCAAFHGSETGFCAACSYHANGGQLILTKNTETDCLEDDSSNVWEPYTCEDKARFWASRADILNSGLDAGYTECHYLQDFWNNRTAPVMGTSTLKSYEGVSGVDCCLPEELQEEDVNTDAAFFCAEYEHVQAGLRPCSYYCEPNKCQLDGETILTRGDYILSLTSGSGYEYTVTGSYEARYRYFDRWDYRGTWNDAQILCERMGASVVAINSEEESQVINTITGYDRELWIGYKAAASSSTWEWASGETTDFTVWRVGEPKAEAPAVPRCAYLTTDDQTRSYTTREWRESDCSDATMTSLLCELGTGTAEWPTPAPTTVTSRGGACFNSTTGFFSCGVDETTCTNQGYIAWMAPGYVTQSGCCICKEDCYHLLETGTDCEGAIR